MSDASLCGSQVMDDRDGFVEEREGLVRRRPDRHIDSLNRRRALLMRVVMELGSIALPPLWGARHHWDLWPFGLAQAECSLRARPHLGCAARGARWDRDLACPCGMCFSWLRNKGPRQKTRPRRRVQKKGLQRVAAAKSAWLGC